MTDREPEITLRRDGVEAVVKVGDVVPMTDGTQAKVLQFDSQPIPDRGWENQVCLDVEEITWWHRPDGRCYGLEDERPAIDIAALAAQRAPAAVPPADGGVALAERLAAFEAAIAPFLAMARKLENIYVIEQRFIVDEYDAPSGGAHDFTGADCLNLMRAMQALRAGHLAPAPASDSGAASEWLVWSNYHQAWWRANKAGYTIHLESAGRYSRDDAISICRGARDGYNGAEMPTEIPVRLADMLPMVRDIKRPPAVAPPGG